MTYYVEVGWAEIEKLASGSEVVVSVSHERSPRHTEPIYVCKPDRFAPAEDLLAKSHAPLIARSAEHEADGGHECCGCWKPCRMPNCVPEKKR